MLPLNYVRLCQKMWPRQIYFVQSSELIYILKFCSCFIKKLEKNEQNGVKFLAPMSSLVLGYFFLLS